MVRLGKNRLACIAVLLVLLVSSCSDEQAGKSCKVSVSIVDGTSSKTIEPESAYEDFMYYTLEAESRTGKVMGPFTFENPLMRMEDMEEGDWTFTVCAYNSKDHPVASGSTEKVIRSGMNDVLIVMDTCPGNGVVSIKIHWDKDISHESSMNLRIGLENSSGDARTYYKNVLTASEETAWSQFLAAGSYTLSLSLLDSSGSLAGAVEAVRIIDGATTQGELDLVSSNAAVQMEISNRVSFPLEMYIDYSPKNLSSSMVNFTCLVSNLPEGVRESSLVVQWYLDGVALPASTALDTMLPLKSGVHRYDITVCLPSMTGTLGSASCLINGG